MSSVQGIFAPIATPFDHQGCIDFDGLAFNLEHLGATSLAGLVLLGSNGEFASLTDGEKRELMTFVRRRWPDEKKMIVGTGCQSLPAVKELNQAAADAGADAVLVLNASYYKGAASSPQSMIQWFTTLADQSPLPLMIYNMPGNTGVNIPASVTVKLSEHPNIIGTKDSSGQIAQIAQVAHQAQKGFVVFAGSGSFLMTTLLSGGVGGTLAVANIAPDYCVQLAKLTLAGDLEKARPMQGHLIPLNGAITARWGVPGLKAAMDYLGWKGGSVRLPFLKLDEGSRKELIQIIETFQENTGWNLKLV